MAQLGGLPTAIPVRKSNMQANLKHESNDDGLTASNPYAIFKISLKQ
jgi:hypothetical protein